ncbi:MAG: hypothetical protein CR989_04800 [Flavobacteriales bacterium]|nr:MAG: hypothetical protein CR989_04800 [Flavobacteriales bacterium]
MKNREVFFLLIIIFSLTSCKDKQQKRIARHVPASEQENWISLFNGSDLNNWIPKIKGLPLGEDPKNTFRVVDGVIQVNYDGYDKFNNTFGHLFYRKPFSNYKLKLKYRFTGEQIKDGPNWAVKNSGIMIHSQPPEDMRLDQDFPLSIEVQMLGGINQDKPRPTGNLCTPGTNVVLKDTFFTPHCINSESDTFFDNQWVEIEVEVHNDSLIRHFINGKDVLSYTKPQVGGDLSDFSEEWQAKDGEPLKQGYISLQSESHPVEFKDIMLMDLDTDK